MIQKELSEQYYIFTTYERVYILQILFEIIICLKIILCCKLL